MVYDATFHKVIEALITQATFPEAPVDALLKTAQSIQHSNKFYADVTDGLISTDFSAIPKQMLRAPHKHFVFDLKTSIGHFYLTGTDVFGEDAKQLNCKELNHADLAPFVRLGCYWRFNEKVDAEALLNFVKSLSEEDALVSGAADIFADPIMEERMLSAAKDLVNMTRFAGVGITSAMSYLGWNETEDRYFVVTGGDVDNRDTVAMFGCLLAMFMVSNMVKLFVMMQCKNIEKKRVTPDLRLNKAKKKNNKVLLSDYYTISLPDYDNSEYSDGTGLSSPKRSHFRRGHIRILTKNYEEPRAVWVSHCLVKGQAPGFVTSNYEVRA